MAREAGLLVQKTRSMTETKWFSGLAKPLFPGKVLLVRNQWPRVAQVIYSVEGKIIVKVHPLLNSKVNVVDTILSFQALFFISLLN